MGHGKKRISYWIDRRLTGLAGPEYHAIISFGLPIEPEDSQYGKYRFQASGRPRNPLGHPGLGSPYTSRTYANVFQPSPSPFVDFIRVRL